VRKTAILCIIVLFLGTLFPASLIIVTADDNAPVLSDPYPENGSTGINPIPILHITISDNNNSMDVSWFSNFSGSWKIFGVNNSVPNGTYYQSNSNFSDYNVIYWWSINCTDGHSWTNGTYHFTTKSNSVPVAFDDFYDVSEDNVLAVWEPGILNNDTDEDEDPLTAILVSNVTNGTLNLNSNGSFNYTPNADYHGVDSFTYMANDGVADSNVATVNISVSSENDPPVAFDDFYDVSEDNVLTVAELGGVLINDTDVDNDALTAVVISNVSNGSLTLYDNGSFIYVPDTHFYGFDNFTYKANDSQADSNIANVNISVSSVNDKPVVNFFFTQSNLINYSIKFTDDSSDVYDPDGGIVSWYWDFGDGMGNSAEKNPIYCYDISGTYTVNLNVTDNNGATNNKNKPVTVLNGTVAEIYVDDDANSSWYNQTHVRTIQEGINHASSGDTVFTYDGIYIENVYVNKTLTLNGASSKTTFIDSGGNDTVVRIESDLVNISGFTIQNSGSNSQDTGIRIFSKHNTISDNNISNNHDGIFLYRDSNHNAIYGNIISSNSHCGIELQKSYSNNISNNINSNNEYGMKLVDSNSNVIYNNCFNNVKNAQDDGDNIWNLTKTLGTNIVGGAYIGGNYWSNYSGEDIDGDGLGDTDLPYNSYGNIQNGGDWLPLGGNKVPFVNFTFTPIYPKISEDVDFIDKSNDSDGYLLNWTWDFGDGTSSMNQNSTHNYPSFGSYDVTLAVEDNDGSINSLIKQIIMKKVYTNRTQDGTTTTINLQYNLSTILTINTTDHTYVNSTLYSGNPTGEDIPNNISSVGNYIDIDVEDESMVTGSINITIFYNLEDLSSSKVYEHQLLGIYFYNDTSKEWQICNETGVNTVNQSGYLGYCWANVWRLTNFTVCGDNEAPSKVTGLIVTDAKDGKLDLTWNAASDNIAVDHYKIYKGGSFLIDTTTTSYRDSGLTNGRSYSYQVSAIDTSENEGTLSDSSSGKPTKSGNNNDDNPPYDPLPPLPPEPTNQKPVADASASERFGFVGTPVTFNGSRSYDPDEDGYIASGHWDFGDGTNFTAKIVAHTYSKSGIYTVTLTVTDNNGDTDTCEIIVVISQANRPPSNPVIDGHTNGSKSTEYMYVAVSTDLDDHDVRYIFNWDDGTDNAITDFVENGTSGNATHIWESAGVYLVMAYAEDEYNATSGTTELMVFIDVQVKFIDDVVQGYLIDYECDGTYNAFHNNLTKDDTAVELQDNGRYLIDINGSGTWDYTYDPATGTINSMKEKVTIEKTEISWVLVVGITLVITIISIIILFKLGYIRIEEIPPAEIKKKKGRKKNKKGKN